MPVLQNKAVKTLMLGILFLSISGCVATPFYGRPMTNRIANDVSAFNKAYAESANAQLLLNILYSRDRLPRQYVGFKEITTTQTRKLSISPKISSIPLGNPASNDGLDEDLGKLWGVGEIGFGGESSTQPDYGISPLISEELTKGALNTIDTKIFEQYWKSGWPKDVLLAVLAENLIKVQYEECPSDESSIQDSITKADSLAESAYYTMLFWEKQMKEMAGQNNNAEPGLTQSPPSRKCEDKILYSRYYDNSAENFLKKKEGSADFMTIARWMQNLRPKDYLISIDTYTHNPTEKVISIQKGAGAGYTPEDLQHLSTTFKNMKEVGLSPSFDEDANTIKLSKGGEAYIRINIKPPEHDEEAIAKLCPELYKTTKRPPGANGSDCFGYWLVELRSFDQAVYYLGELLRHPPERNNRPEPDVWSGPHEMVSAADCKDGASNSSTPNYDTYKAPLFRVLRNDKPLPNVDRWYPDVRMSYSPAGQEAARENAQFEPGANDIWAARVRYRGSWYFTGPATPLNTECEIPADRSSTVLTLLGQIFEMNRSPESVRLPARIGN